MRRRAETVRPTTLRVEAASVCQLKCPACPTPQGLIRKQIGGNVLAFANFRRMIDDNPRIVDVELSNWGEIFLNRELPEIMEYAFKRGVTLRADNGVNLNTVSEAMLEALVRYKFRSLRCSIDGATPETYAIYRQGGDFDQVIRNIRRINAYKQRYNSKYPYLTWQFIAFAHNAHELDAAQALAATLGMGFWVKLPWNEEPAAAQVHAERVRKETGAASVHEYREIFGRPYMADRYCGQLWNRPQVHTDGKVLGCCVNHWGDFGNAFEDGLDAVLNGERMRYARRMLEGKAEARADIPCTRCGMYADMQRAQTWLDGTEVSSTTWRQRLRRNRLTNRLINRLVNRPVYVALEAVARRTGIIRQEPEAF
jgi:MoaA/NifB/PqqE/SkfB family radical SAM enzyme